MVLSGYASEIRGMETKIPFILNKLNLPRQSNHRYQAVFYFDIHYLCINILFSKVGTLQVFLNFQLFEISFSLRVTLSV